MEITMLPVGAANVGSVANTSRNVGVESFASILRTGKGEVREPANQEDLEQKDILQDVLKRTAELVSIGDRGLKFEMVEEAGVYQLQVIDMSDGRVVRKVPPDEVLKMVAHLKEQLLDDFVDVYA